MSLFYITVVSGYFAFAKTKHLYNILKIGMYIRYSKITLIWNLAFFTSLIVFNNIIDYGSNYRVVTHVLKMDTLFSGNKETWRSINSPFIYHLAYVFIIITEIIIAALCWVAGFRLLKTVKDGHVS